MFSPVTPRSLGSPAPRAPQLRRQRDLLAGLLAAARQKRRLAPSDTAGADAELAGTIIHRLVQLRPVSVLDVASAAGPGRASSSSLALIAPKDDDPERAMAATVTAMRATTAVFGVDAEAVDIRADGGGQRVYTVRSHIIPPTADLPTVPALAPHAQRARERLRSSLTMTIRVAPAGEAAPGPAASSLVTHLAAEGSACEHPELRAHVQLATVRRSPALAAPLVADAAAAAARARAASPGPCAAVPRAVSVARAPPAARRHRGLAVLRVFGRGDRGRWSRRGRTHGHFGPEGRRRVCARRRWSVLTAAATATPRASISSHAAPRPRYSQRPLAVAQPVLGRLPGPLRPCLLHAVARVVLHRPGCVHACADVAALLRSAAQHRPVHYCVLAYFSFAAARC